jgi:serine/threonine-protein kinase
MTTDLGQPGQIIDGKYRITRLLGTGGMGAVFEGENIRIRRKVAIKMLHGSVSSQPEVVARFEREAQAAAMVGSEHICEVLDLGELPDHTRYMVMEYLEGGTLSELIKRNGRLLPYQSIPLLTQILDALGAAHAAGIIHRDLKPDNVFIVPQRGGIQNFVKILDFGVSKFSQLGGEAMNVTRAGAVVGTPYYMSPEQARGSSAIDARTDVYAIGVLLYQATTGQVPYQAETFNELLFKIVLEVAPPPQTYVPDIDPQFAAIIQRAMAREPDQRFQSCMQFKEALLQFHAARAQQPYAPRPQDPMPARTEILDTSKVPGFDQLPPPPGRPAAPRPAAGASMPQPPAGGNMSAASWPGLPPPPPDGEGTLPLQPGLTQQQMQAAAAGAFLPGASQSGPNWQSSSSPGAAPPTATANAWGNASSASGNVPVPVKPRSKAPLAIAVISVAMLVGVGAAVLASSMIDKPKAAPAQSAAPVVTATAAPTPSVTAPVAPVAPTASASAAPSAEPSAVPVASAVPLAGKTPVLGKSLPPGKSPAGKAPPPPPPPGKTPGKTGGKVSGGDLGY